MKIIYFCLKICDFLPDSVSNRSKENCISHIEKEACGRFAESNRKLGELIDIDLSKYGYEL